MLVHLKVLEVVEPTKSKMASSIVASGFTGHLEALNGVYAQEKGNKHGKPSFSKPTTEIEVTKAKRWHNLLGSQKRVLYYQRSQKRVLYYQGSQKIFLYHQGSQRRFLCHQGSQQGFLYLRGHTGDFFETCVLWAGLVMSYR